MLSPEVPRVYVWRRKTPAHAWAWLMRKLGIHDDRPVILLMESGKIYCGFMERCYV